MEQLIYKKSDGIPVPITSPRDVLAICSEDNAMCIGTKKLGTLMAIPPYTHKSVRTSMIKALAAERLFDVSEVIVVVRPFFKPQEYGLLKSILRKCSNDELSDLKLGEVAHTHPTMGVVPSYMFVREMLQEILGEMCDPGVPKNLDDPRLTWH